MYKVEGYDKDNDVYVEYWQGTDLEKAKELAMTLDCIARNDELVSPGVSRNFDSEKRFIDWVQVTNEKDEVVYLPER